MVAPENRPKHHRRSIRLAGYDYSAEGGYYVTIVTQGRVCLFGEVLDGEMQLNDFGRIVYEEWFNTAKLRPNIELLEDEFVIMPNHIHGIIWINEIPGRGEKIIDSTMDINHQHVVGAYSTTRFARVRIIRAIRPYDRHPTQLGPLSEGSKVLSRQELIFFETQRAPLFGSEITMSTSSIQNAIITTLPITSTRIP